VRTACNLAVEKRKIEKGVKDELPENMFEYH
jgi:hypothetical protein